MIYQQQYNARLLETVMERDRAPAQDRETASDESKESSTHVVGVDEMNFDKKRDPLMEEVHNSVLRYGELHKSRISNRD